MQIHDWRRIYGKVGDEYAQFEASDQDTANSAGKVAAGHTFQYYGFLTSNGAWVIMEFDTTTATGDIAYRYIGGQTHAGYLAAWIARATNVYTYYDLVTIP